MGPAVVFDDVSKKFRRGERHDSLRDLFPSLLRGGLRRRTAESLTKEEFWALRNVSFEVAPGEALGVIGANGAGKSTALKVLTRILKPTAGRCTVHGRVGALIEVAAGFHPDLTGRENVFLQGAIMGMKRAEIAKRFDEIVDFAGVGAFIDTPVKRFSSGMNARLGFSIAAHLEPDVLIVDEVLSVGDLAFQESCQQKIEMFRDAGVTIVLVSHNLGMVLQLCTKAILLKDGQVTRAGSPRDVVADYCSAVGEPTPGSPLTPVSIRTSVRPRGTSEIPIVEPGTRCCLGVQLVLNRRLEHATVALIVWDLARNFYAYGVDSDRLGIEPISGAPGDRIDLEFWFSAHLVRGLYAVEVKVLERTETVAALRPAWQFSVAETVSYRGVANLYLEGEIIGRTGASSSRHARANCAEVDVNPHPAVPASVER